MVGSPITVAISPTTEHPRRTTAAVEGTLRRGELDRAEWGAAHAILLPDEPKRVWFKVEGDGPKGAMHLYLAPAWFTSASVSGKGWEGSGARHLEIRLDGITLDFFEY